MYIEYFSMRIIGCIPFLYPPDQGEHGLTELFSVFGQGIFNPWRYLRKGFTVDQVFFPEIFSHISQGLGADIVEPLHDIVEPHY